jgi:hypothetical protein
MGGSIAVDIIGSLYEALPIKTTDFPFFLPLCRFTNDTVLTVAFADRQNAQMVSLPRTRSTAFSRLSYST